MTKQDKRVCGVCLEHGHTSVDCPRRHGDMVMVSEALPDELRRLQAASAERERARMAYTARHEPSAMVYTGPYEVPTVTLPPQVPSPPINMTIEELGEIYALRGGPVTLPETVTLRVDGQDIPEPKVTLRHRIKQSNVTPDCEACGRKDREIEQLRLDITRLKDQNAERQRAYRERRA